MWKQVFPDKIHFHRMQPARRDLWLGYKRKDLAAIKWMCSRCLPGWHNSFPSPPMFIHPRAFPCAFLQQLCNNPAFVLTSAQLMFTCQVIILMYQICLGPNGIPNLTWQQAGLVVTKALIQFPNQRSIQKGPIWACVKVWGRDWLTSSAPRAAESTPSPFSKPDSTPL